MHRARWRDVPNDGDKRSELLTLGDCLRRMRAARDLKQIEVAHAAGITESQVSEIERGKTNPGWLLLTRLVRDGLGSTITEFAHDYERP